MCPGNTAFQDGVETITCLAITSQWISDIFKRLLGNNATSGIVCCVCIYS